MMKPLMVALLLLLTGCGAVWVLGCAASASSDGAMQPFAPTSQPATIVAPTATAAQNGAANIQAPITYTSEFSFGVMTYLIANDAGKVFMMYLVVWLSHRREMKRIAMNGKH